MRSCFSKCSEVHLKINFVISDMKLYLVKFFFLNIHEATSLLDLDKPPLIFFSKTTGFSYPQAVNVGKRETWQHKVLVFW